MYFTPREKQILNYILRYANNSNKDLARQLGMREGTVKCHMSHIYLKLGVSNRAAVIAVLLGAEPIRNTRRLRTFELYLLGKTHSPAAATESPRKPDKAQEHHCPSCGLWNG